MNTGKRIIPEPLFSHSQSLRSHQTPWESKLWYYLRAGRFYGLKFKRQVQIGLYIVDFSCKEKNVVIELDGSQHQSSKDYDGTRDMFLRQQGYSVIRIWNNDIDKNITGVLETIRVACGM